MDSQQLSFDQIISSLSYEDMTKPYPDSQNLREENNQAITPALQRFYLAFYAKAAHEHVNFEKFSPQNQACFKRAIEKMYAAIHTDRIQGDFLREIFQNTYKYIEDRHFGIMLPGLGEKIQPSVGKNFLHNTTKPQNYRSFGEGVMTVNGEEKPAWSIGTMKRGNEDVLIVAIEHLGIKNDYESWKEFIETFDSVYLTDKEKWEKGRIILDVRGNTGGEDKPIDHIAKRLYGNVINPYKRCEIKDTPLSNWLLHQHGAYRADNLAKAGINEQDLIQRRHFSGTNKILFDETHTYYPFHAEKGYKGKIDILLDRFVASAAESAYTSFYHHPNVRYIGENTAGMQQYTQGTFTAPWGGKMRVGVTKVTHWDKTGEDIEVIGHKPDVNCSGRDAFEVALKLPIDDGRIVGFRKTNEEPSKHCVFKDYDPRINNDARRAFYASSLEAGLKKIENENIANGVKPLEISKGKESEDKKPASFDFRTSEIASFYNLWQRSMGNTAMLEGFEDSNIFKLQEAVPNEFKSFTEQSFFQTVQKFSKINHDIINGGITDINGLSEAVRRSFSNGEQMSSALQTAYKSWQTFYHDPETQKQTKNVIAALNRLQKSPAAQEALTGMCAFFGAEPQTKIPSYVLMFPKENPNARPTSGYSDEHAIWVHYSRERNEPRENYFFGTVCLNRRIQTPWHEGGHFLFTNTQTWKNMENMARSNGQLIRQDNHTLKTMDILSKYFDANPQQKRNKKFSSRIAALDAINEAFACCADTLFSEKRDPTSMAQKKDWYYGFEAADKLAPQVYPLFKEYIAQGKKLDDAFFKRLNDNLKGFEAFKQSTAVQAFKQANGGR